MKVLATVITLIMVAVSAHAQMASDAVEPFVSPGCIGCPVWGPQLGQANYQRTPPSMRPQQPAVIIGGPPLTPTGTPFIGAPTSPSETGQPAAGPAARTGLPTIPSSGVPGAPAAIPAPTPSGLPPTSTPGVTVPSAPSIPGNFPRFPAPASPGTTPGAMPPGVVPGISSPSLSPGFP